MENVVLVVHLLLALSLIGVPFTAGFVSKVNLATAAANEGWWWAVAVIVVTSILAIIYMGNILKEAYFKEPPIVNGEVVLRNEAPLMMLIPMWALALLSIAIGINSDLMVQAANGAAQLLFPLADALPGGATP